MANCVNEMALVTVGGHLVFVDAMDETTPDHGYEYRMVFTPDEADELADELRAAAEEARSHVRYSESETEEF